VRQADVLIRCGAGGSLEEEKLWVDLRPYSNPSIYYVTEDSSVTKASHGDISVEGRSCLFV
jgi:hypothetical protein